MCRSMQATGIQELEEVQEKRGIFSFREISLSDGQRKKMEQVKSQK